MKRFVLFVLAMLLLALAARPASACNNGYQSFGFHQHYGSSGYNQQVLLLTPVYAPPVQLVLAAYAPPVQAVAPVYQAAPPPVAAAMAAPPVQAYAPPVQAVAIPETAYGSVQAFALQPAVEYLAQNYGASNVEAVEFLRTHGHVEAVQFQGNPAEIKVEIKDKRRRR